MAYQVGTAVDQHLFAQHDAQWIPQGFSNQGNILVFNNGRGRPDGDYSSIDEFVPPVEKKGNYICKKVHTFGLAKPAWNYTSSQKPDFYSSHISGCQRLPNGNPLICSGENGILFEVTPQKEVVWKFINPVFGEPRPPMGAPKPDKDKRGQEVRKPLKSKQQSKRPGMGGPDKSAPQNSVFKAHRHAPDYPGLKGKDLPPGEPLVRNFRKKEAAISLYDLRICLISIQPYQSKYNFNELNY